MGQAPEVTGIRRWRVDGAHRSTMPEYEKSAKGIISNCHGSRPA
jgi:hypothetical protein